LAHGHRFRSAEIDGYGARYEIGVD
jgi:hypothetical protein